MGKTSVTQMLLTAHQIFRGPGCSGDFLLASLLEQICHLTGDINYFPMQRPGLVYSPACLLRRLQKERMEQLKKTVSAA